MVEGAVARSCGRGVALFRSGGRCVDVAAPWRRGVAFTVLPSWGRRVRLGKIDMGEQKSWRSDGALVGAGARDREKGRLMTTLMGNLAWLLMACVVLSMAGCEQRRPEGERGGERERGEERGRGDERELEREPERERDRDPEDRPQEADASRWTAGIVEGPAFPAKPPSSGTTLLQRVEAAEHPEFDRVVFEFGGDRLPSYHVEYIDRPVRQCGSGDVVQLAGDAWLEVRLHGAQAHTDDGAPTVAPRERRLDLSVLLELESTCDFEAEVTWVMGLASPNRYRVLELSSPTRLVIDVRH